MTRRARDVLIDILRDEGITHVFGNPGSTEMPLMDALVDTPDIRYVLGLQEATAVGMADGWALATGRTAFVNLHAMGGLGNAMGVLVASKASETPLVVTAGQQDTRHLMTEPWLSGDLVALAAPVTKWAKELRRADDVGPALRRAFGLARTPPCGPVFLSLPMDILDQDVNHPTPPASSPPRLGPSPDAARLAETLATPRSGSGRRPARRRPAGGRERWPGRLRRGRRLSGLGHAAHVAHRVSVPPSLLGRRAEARLRRHARALAIRAGDRAGRRTRLRRLSLSRSRAGARRRRRACISPTIRRRSDANTPPTWRCLATSARRSPRSPSASRNSSTRRKVAARLAARGARRREAREATRKDILAESASAPLSADAAVLAALDALPEDAIIANDSAATFGRVQDLMTTEPGRYFFARGGVLGCSMPAAVGAVACDKGLGRRVRRRRRGDVFAAGFVERRA